MSSASALLVTLALTLTIIIAEDDVTCLRDFKFAVSDPASMLSSWSFSFPGNVGFICKFTGVSCFDQQEIRAIILSLSSFSLSGQIPSSLSLCSSITNLDLSHNSFSGPLPSSLCTWLPYLVNLDLSFNSFSGPIPSNFSDCKFLNSLVLSDNQLSGPIPPDLRALEMLKNLDLSSNQLTGQIPPALGGLSGLKNLDLSSNQLTGQIPHALDALNGLINLDLSSNQLTGQIPPTLGGLSGLINLDLSSNQLTGQIPSDLSSKFDSSSFSNNHIDDDSDDMFDLYLSMGIGYGVGLWFIGGVFVYVDTWRIAFFRFLDASIIKNF